MARQIAHGCCFILKQDLLLQCCACIGNPAVTSCILTGVGAWCWQAITPDEEDEIPVKLPDDPVKKERETHEKEMRDKGVGSSDRPSPSESSQSRKGEEQRGSAREESAKSVSESEKLEEYEFTPWEDRILEVVMEAMRMAGLALSMRAMATVCLGTSQASFCPSRCC